MISVIIPIYNQATKVRATIASIEKQTINEPIEVIIVNDGSTDHVSSYLESYIIRNPNTKLSFNFVNQDNKGAPAARNRGLVEAKGDYLFFCDADAKLVPTALEKMKLALDTHPEASYAYPSFYWGRKKFIVGPFDPQKLKSGPMIHTMALMRRGAMTPKGWDESIKKLQDWDLWLTMLEEGKTGVWVNEYLFSIEPGGHISSWVPSFVYKLFPNLPVVKKYQTALAIVKKKHNLA